MDPLIRGPCGPGRTGAGIDAVLERMHRLLAPMEAAGDPKRFFLSTYTRTTAAVRDELAAGTFRDPEWVERWDVAFAEHYLDALEAHGRGDPAPLPWQAAFDAGDVPPLRHVLLDMNAHINFDLPQALLAVISSAELDDPALVHWRHVDHRHIDTVLASRVGAEDDRLASLGTASLSDRVLSPLNRLGTKRFLRESRRKVWANAMVLDRARRRGPFALADGLDQLAHLCADKVEQLTAPGPVILKLAVRGFGVRLPGTDQRWP
ncbi:DUF5995 family protein [Oryzihumus leptocrescens]|uniref:Uncharacterized protein n=1 Tax=Oryzihumus leptocrescens TaxID=297536 RepID=A0A542ZET9_9MICO|nr:DUF5995 family protein [Oryzihumus leptocrescens]TQL58827.1 hypothetical protein FB474_0166 [Oryzihumus leptocrescens]